MSETNQQPLIDVVERGTSFLVYTSNRIKKEAIPIKFCHKDRNGDFQNGVTTEAILLMLISRQQHLTNKDDSTDNIKALLFLKQAYECVNARKASKRAGKDDYKRNGLPVQTGGEQS